jgi:arginine deiminase
MIVATQYLSQYYNTFPNWEVFNLPSIKNNGGFGHWHVNNHNVLNNNGFSEHINKYASDWVGNFKETVFEANMLVIDKHHVLAIKENKELTQWLKNRGIEVIYCDFRCRSFWDGGLHCLTTDIFREGKCENYFPERPDINYLDWMC